MSRADNESDGVSTLDPDNRNIHIEPQLDAHSGRFELYIHYETEPYTPEKKFTARFPSDQGQAYLDRRRAFRKTLMRNPLDGFVVGGWRWNHTECG